MKAILFSVLTLISTSAFAEKVYTEVQAKSVSSTPDQAKSCTYTLVDLQLDGQGLKAYLNSDKDAGIFGSADLTKVRLPLTEGQNETGWSNIKILKKGSIIQIVERTEAPSFGYIYDVMTLEASDDLTQIKSGKVQQFLTDRAGNKQLRNEMNCVF